MNTGLQKLGAWSGLAAWIVFFSGFLTASFIPPMPPSLTPEQVAAVYQNHTNAIRLGGVLLVISALFCGPFVAAIYLQLRRMEGPKRPIASLGQFASGIANIQFFILPGILFVVAAYRPDRNVDVLYGLNDLAWFVTMLPWTTGASQMLCIGAGVLAYGNATSAYPRWVGYFNIWLAVGMVVSSLIPFFKTGPFAWNGLIGWWFAASLVGVWMPVMVWMTLKAINKDTE